MACVDGFQEEAKVRRKAYPPPPLPFKYSCTWRHMMSDTRLMDSGPLSTLTTTSPGTPNNNLKTLRNRLKVPHSTHSHKGDGFQDSVW